MRGNDLAVFHPKRKQVEHHDPDGTIRHEIAADPLGGNQNIGFLTDNMAISFADVNLVNLDALRIRIASPNATSRIEVRKGSKTGQLLGSANVQNTGGFQNWGYVDVPIIDPGDTFDLFLVFRGASGYLYNLNWVDFVGPGLAAGPSAVAPPTATVAEPTGANGWYTAPVDVTLTADAAREYRIGTGAWTAYTAPVRFATDGVFRLDYRARKDGLPSTGRSLDLKLDQAAPATAAALEGVVSGETFTGAVRFTLTAADATSGVAKTEWRLAGDAAAQAYTAAVTLAAAAGERTVEYRSVDAAGNAEAWKRASFTSPSGTRPKVTLQSPGAGLVVPASGRVPFHVVVDGRGPEGCADVTVRLLAGTTVAGTGTGCTGTIVAPAAAADLRGYTLEATYTADKGTGDHVPLIRGTATSALQPARKQAEHYDTDAAVRTEATGDTLGGGLNVGFIRTGQVLSYSGVNLKGISTIRLRLATNTIGGTVEVRKGSATGALLGQTTVTSTGGFQSYRYFDAPLTGVTDELIRLVLVFRATGTHYIANINFFEFVGDGTQPERRPTLSLPSDVKGTAATAAGAPVTYSATASDLYDGAVPVTCTPASGATFAVGTTKVTCSATNAGGYTATGSFDVTVTQVVPADGPVGGTVPATLALTLDGPATFAPFTPGVEREYTAGTKATVISTAGDAALSVSDPGRLTNGTFSLPEPLRVELSKTSWTGPVANERVDIAFKQRIKAGDALRTGTYAKTLTFTLSTTTP
ncbi:carbohydrate-binding protein [Solirubrobacter phytolaccae]|uniref:Carbohydrate-binding protein n=2 Tax=Solirubrobacter phytolaccae TaxID=1404360 RepID=A0A9X3N9L8_9ACTN|nr:carbohydrate-binding protein [Solirubrobacter phytolaccae]